LLHRYQAGFQRVNGSDRRLQRGINVQQEHKVTHPALGVEEPGRWTAARNSSAWGPTCAT